MQAVAKLRDYQMSERKVRLVADLIRDKKLNDALNILRFNKKGASKPLEKLLMSAVANWEYKLDMMESADDYDLKISEIFVDQGPMLKRFRPAAYGRAHNIRKRSCHITIKLDNMIPLPSELETEEDEQGTEEMEYVSEGLEDELVEVEEVESDENE